MIKCRTGNTEHCMDFFLVFLFSMAANSAKNNDRRHEEFLTVQLTSRAMPNVTGKVFLHADKICLRGSLLHDKCIAYEMKPRNNIITLLSYNITLYCRVFVRHLNRSLQV